MKQAAIIDSNAKSGKKGDKMRIWNSKWSAGAPEGRGPCDGHGRRLPATIIIPSIHLLPCQATIHSGKSFSPEKGM